MPRAGRVLLFHMAILVVSPRAWAAGGDTTDLAAQAQAACLAGDCSKGVAILADLYVSTRNAIYIFNQGRCFEQCGRYEQAIVRFREYQRKNTNAGRPLDPLAEQHIADCQALLDKQKVAPSAAPPPPDPAAPAAPLSVPLSAGVQAPESTEARQVDLTQTAPPPSDGQSEPSILGRWWFWTAVGAVVAGGVTAGLLLSRGGGGDKIFCPDCAGTGEVNLP
jgi:hypothetical protein